MRASCPKRFGGTSEKKSCIKSSYVKGDSLLTHVSFCSVFNVLSMGKNIPFGQAFFIYSGLLQGLICNGTWHESEMHQAPLVRSTAWTQVAELPLGQAQLCWHLMKSGKIIRLALTALAWIEDFYVYLGPTAEMTQLRGAPKLNDTSASHSAWGKQADPLN